MSTTDDFKAVVKRLRDWGFTVKEWSGCYGRSNGIGWSSGKPVGHINHHYVCSMNPDQGYINGLVGNLAAGSVVNWFADVNGVAYLIGTGPMNHSGTGNSGVLNRTKSDQPNYSVAGSAGDISGNSHYSGTECQHPGDSTPWPSVLLEVMYAINAAEFVQWGYSANRAINHYAWTNRKIDMSWMGGPSSGSSQGKKLVENVQRYMDGGNPPDNGDDDPMTNEEHNALMECLTVMRRLNSNLDQTTTNPDGTKVPGQTNAGGIWRDTYKKVSALDD